MTCPASSPARPDLDDLLRDEDWRHRLRLHQGHAGEFFRSWSGGAALLEERRHWLGRHPDRHAPWLPEAAPLAQAAAGYLNDFATPIASGDAVQNPRDLWMSLAARLEPDLVLLDRSPGGHRLLAAAVCFPSAWRPEEKLGRTLAEIHEIVPDLEPQLGRSIDAFLNRLVPGPAWFRTNWGLTASGERNQHPDRALPRLAADANLDGAFLRIEYQCLAALPGAPGILFGIRVEQIPLDGLRRSRPQAARALARLLRSMPDPMAYYKGLSDARHRLAQQLE